jgi:hypothetical protein
MLMTMDDNFTLQAATKVVCDIYKPPPPFPLISWVSANSEENIFSSHNWAFFSNKQQKVAEEDLKSVHRADHTRTHTLSKIVLNIDDGSEQTGSILDRDDLQSNESFRAFIQEVFEILAPYAVSARELFCVINECFFLFSVFYRTNKQKWAFSLL